MRTSPIPPRNAHANASLGIAHVFAFTFSHKQAIWRQYYSGDVDSDSGKLSKMQAAASWPPNRTGATLE
jgi:hypothetical protein